MSILTNKTIVVTGGTGMVGKYLIKNLKTHAPKKIISASLDDIVIDDVECKKVDLTYLDNCLNLLENADYLFHLAGIKGSPKMAQKYPASFAVPMLMFNTNILEAARRQNMEWSLYTSSVGVYAQNEILNEDDVWKTMPSKNDWFAGWIKRIGELQIEAYNIQYDKKNMSIVRPANIYGRADNFNPETCMVIPSIISRLFAGETPLTVWGDGSQLRDFIHAEDVALGMIFAVEHKITEPINLGSGNIISIKELAETIVKSYNKLTDNDVDIVYDTSKPTGDKIRRLNIERISKYGFKNSVSLEEGIIDTMEWYMNNTDTIKNRFDTFVTTS